MAEPSGDGTVFKITPQGGWTTLHNFCSLANCADGFGLRTPMIQARDGNFYGASPAGGHRGAHTVLDFAGWCSKLPPRARLLSCTTFALNELRRRLYPECRDQATDGNLYGTTAYSPNSFGHGGTIFRLTTMGSLTTLHSFCVQTNCTDGDSPEAPLTQGSDGNLYGTTAYASANNFGNVFQDNTTGWYLNDFITFALSPVAATEASPRAS